MFLHPDRKWSLSVRSAPRWARLRAASLHFLQPNWAPSPLKERSSRQVKTYWNLTPVITAYFLQMSNGTCTCRRGVCSELAGEGCVLCRVAWGGKFRSVICRNPAGGGEGSVHGERAAGGWRASSDATGSSRRRYDCGTKGHAQQLTDKHTRVKSLNFVQPCSGLISDQQQQHRLNPRHIQHSTVSKTFMLLNTIQV